MINNLQRRRQRMPAYQLTLNGKDVTGNLQGRLILLTLTDNRGLEADQLDISLDDSNDDLDIPSRGVKLQLAIGWAGEPLVDKGTYTVDEVAHTGAPDKITIRARSADLRAGLRLKREKSWHNTTLGEMVRVIAGNAGLTPGISDDLASVKIRHLDQTNESDLNLLTRVCKDHGAIATIKKDKLIVFRAGAGATVSGLEITPITIERSDGDQHNYQSSDRDAYSGVIAIWVEGTTGKRHEALVGDAENAKTLRHVHATEVEAMEAALAEMGRIQRATATLSFTLAYGRPDAYPEAPVLAVGWKPVISDTAWVAYQVVHQIQDSGFTTKLECEVLGAEQEQPKPGDITGVKAKWLDKKTGKRSTALAGREGNVKTLGTTYASEKAAKKAAAREWEKIR